MGSHCRSDDHCGLALGGIESEKEILKGLDVETFSRAPPEAMIKTLQHAGCVRGAVSRVYVPTWLHVCLGRLEMTRQ